MQRTLDDESAATTLDAYADLFEDDLTDVAVCLDQGALAAHVNPIIRV